MRLLFYAPFKPLDHPDPSGDRTIARGLYDFLRRQGHEVQVASSMRLRWITGQPWRWPMLAREIGRALRLARRWKPDLWLTYHAYYKAPDLIGPLVCRRRLPYVIFQGAFATRPRRSLKTWPGYRLNRAALEAASHVFANKRVDEANLRRILPPQRISYVAPGLPRDLFHFDPAARRELRRSWGLPEDALLVLAAAMFRPDVKSEGLRWLMLALAPLGDRFPRLHLAIAGDGHERAALERLARESLPGRVIFAGRLAREQMHRFYSAGDLFAFPGIRESLGMVYLEAQACGLPVVAFDNGGIPEVVENGETGFLTAPYAMDPFNAAVARLLEEVELRKAMGRAAIRRMAERHDLESNYRGMERVLTILSMARGFDFRDSLREGRR